MVMATHPIVHVEIPTNSNEEAGKFYSGLFDWKLEHDERFDYLQFEAEGGPGGGFTKIGEQGTEAGKVLVYVGTDDIDATLSKAESLGGKIIQPKMEIPETGWFGVF